MNNFVAVGDIVTDAFIKLKDASVNCEVNNVSCTITMPFGEKIPYESVDVVQAVGNSANASVAAARLGLKSALVTNMGDDQNGKECLAVLKTEGVATDFVTVEPGKITNYHYVLWYESDRTILVKHQEYKRTLPDIGNPKWLYLSSLGEDTLAYQIQISEYLKKHPEIKLAFQPGTFQIESGKDKLKDIYARSNIFFCNVQEAGKIIGLHYLEVSDMLDRISSLGPKMVVITDGVKGAYAYDGKNYFYQAPYPDPKPPFDRTGAGDAFASTTVAALELGKDLPTALLWGAVNSMSVVQYVGAQKGLLTKEKIEELIRKAPEAFTTSKKI